MDQEHPPRNLRSEEEVRQIFRAVQTFAQERQSTALIQQNLPTGAQRSLQDALRIFEDMRSSSNSNPSPPDILSGETVGLVSEEEGRNYILEDDISNIVDVPLLHGHPSSHQRGSLPYRPYSDDTSHRDSVQVDSLPEASHSADHVGEEMPLTNAHPSSYQWGSLPYRLNDSDEDLLSDHGYSDIDADSVHVTTIPDASPSADHVRRDESPPAYQYSVETDLTSGADTTEYTNSIQPPSYERPPDYVPHEAAPHSRDIQRQLHPEPARLTESRHRTEQAIIRLDAEQAIRERTIINHKRRVQSRIQYFDDVGNAILRHLKFWEYVNKRS